jgi:hypothetical protein
LTEAPVLGKVAFMTPPSLRRLDDDRRRRRAQILAEFAEVTVLRDRLAARRCREERLRDQQFARRREH